MFAASSLPECIQPGTALLAFPGCPVPEQFRIEWEETLNVMGLGEQSLFTEMPKAVTSKYHKERSKKQHVCLIATVTATIIEMKAQSKLVHKLQNY